MAAPTPIPPDGSISAAGDYYVNAGVGVSRLVVLEVDAFPGDADGFAAGTTVQPGYVGLAGNLNIAHDSSGLDITSRNKPSIWALQLPGSGRLGLRVTNTGAFKLKVATVPVPNNVI